MGLLGSSDVCVRDMALRVGHMLLIQGYWKSGFGKCGAPREPPICRQEAGLHREKILHKDLHSVPLRAEV